MELELGLKVTRVLDDFTSADVLIAKDRAGPLFLSSETNTVFILTAHLRGYKRANIKININSDGTRIGISGEKPVQETVMVGYQLYKKSVEIRGFKKTFKIPEGVELDKIKAKFNEEAILTIIMPKRVKGVFGIELEEVKDEVVAGEGTEPVQVTANGGGDGGGGEGGDEAMKKLAETCEVERSTHEGEKASNSNVEGSNKQEAKAAAEEENRDEIKSTESVPSEMTNMPSAIQSDEERHPNKPENQNHDHENENVDKNEKNEKGGDIEAGNSSPDVEVPEAGEEIQSTPEDERRPPRRSTMCVPMMTGSALFLSFIAFVIHFIRTKNKPSKQKS